MSNWCRICRQRPVAHRGDPCLGCLGHMETQLESITRWPAKPPPRPGLWARAWAWAEQHLPDWTADLGTTRLATTVANLPDAWAFIMARIDEVGPAPSVTISPFWRISHDPDDDQDGATGFEVVVSGMVPEKEPA